MGPRSGSVRGPIWGPSGGGHFRLRSFSGPPHTRICFIRRSQNFHVLKMGVLGGGRFGLQKDPPRQLNLSSDLGSSRGPRSGSVWGPSGVPFGPPKVAPFSGPETRPKPYIYNGFSDFRTLEKGLQSDPLQGPHLASRGAPKISEKGVQNFRKRCNYNTFAISGGPSGGPFGVLFGVLAGVHFKVPFRGPN